MASASWATARIHSGRLSEAAFSLGTILGRSRRGTAIWALDPSGFASCVRPLVVATVLSTGFRACLWARNEPTTSSDMNPHSTASPLSRGVRASHKNVIRCSDCCNSEMTPMDDRRSLTTSPVIAWRNADSVSLKLDPHRARRRRFSRSRKIVLTIHVATRQCDGASPARSGCCGSSYVRRRGPDMV